MLIIGLVANSFAYEYNMGRRFFKIEYHTIVLKRHPFGCLFVCYENRTGRSFADRSYLDYDLQRHFPIGSCLFCFMVPCILPTTCFVIKLINRKRSGKVEIFVDEIILNGVPANII